LDFVKYGGKLVSNTFKKHRVLISIGVTLIIGAFIIVNVIKERGEIFEVRTDTVKKGDITQIVSGYGKIQSVKEVNISAYVAAEIKKLHISEGDAVTRGQLLVELDQTRYEAALERVQSDLLSARANLTNTGIRLKRAKELFSSGFISRSELDEAQLNFDLMESRLEQVKANLKQVKDDLAKTRLVSPIDGTVIVLNKEVGEMALSSQLQTDVIMTLGDLSRMEMVVEVDESDVTLVSLGDSAKIEVDALPDRKFNGAVTEIANKATTRGRGTQDEVTIFEVKVRVNDENVDILRSGMSATVDIETETHMDILYIPIQAITTRDIANESEAPKGQVVFVVENGKAKMTPIDTGIMNETDVEIISGLKKNQVVVTGSFRTLSKLLKDGSRVKINNIVKPYREDSDKEG
jgi:HlyD family secretion protein